MASEPTVRMATYDGYARRPQFDDPEVQREYDHQAAMHYESQRAADEDYWRQQREQGDLYP